MCIQAKEYQGFLGTPKSKRKTCNGLFPRTFWEYVTFRKLEFRYLASRTERIFCCFEPPTQLFVSINLNNVINLIGRKEKLFIQNYMQINKLLLLLLLLEPFSYGLHLGTQSGVVPTICMLTVRTLKLHLSVDTLLNKSHRNQSHVKYAKRILTNDPIPIYQSKINKYREQKHLCSVISNLVEKFALKIW